MDISSVLTSLKEVKLLVASNPRVATVNVHGIWAPKSLL